MGIQMHTFRRGATYTWRKRLPASLGGGVFQISLRTTNPLIGRRLATILCAESCAVVDAMIHDGLNKDEARKLLVAVIAREHHKIAALRLAEAENPAAGAWERAKSADWAMGKALSLLAERGASGCHLTDADRVAMQTEGRSDSDIKMLERVLDQEARNYAEDPRQGLNNRSFSMMRHILGREQFSALELIHGRQIYYRGRGAVLLSGSEQSISEQETREAAELARCDFGSDQDQPPASRQGRENPTADDGGASHSSWPAPSADPSPAAIATQAGTDPPAYDPALMALVGRLMDDKRRQKMSEPMITQMTQSFRIFAEATHVSDIRFLRQEHIARFVEVMHKMPVHHGKSPKQRDKPLSVILKNPLNQPVGLSATTINRNLGYLGQLLIKGRSEGFRNLGDLDPGSLRQRKTRRERDERPPFSAEDVQAIFRHPIWHGYRSKGKWHEPGNVVLRDGLYWLPMIAALSGARRGEIAGLKAAEILTVDDIPCMMLQINANRGLKNLTSARLVPLHPQLLEMGLVAWAQDRMLRDGPRADLFPDMRPQKLPPIEQATGDEEGGKFGDQINYRFNKLVDRQITTQRAEKTFHSFRHYVATQLGRMADVREQVRKDILGHAGGSMTEERYTETSPPDLMLAAISRLPWLPL